MAVRQLIAGIMLFGLLAAGLVVPAWANYIDPVNSPKVTGQRGSGASQVAGLSNGTIAELINGYTNSPSVRVLNPDGTQVYSTSLAAALGARANNKSGMMLYPIANGELIVTVEGTTNGCDNNTNNPFMFLRLSATGAVATPLTAVSVGTNSYNCYTDMAELSNGNLAFTYQTAGDSYSLRILQPNGTAVTSQSSIQKTGTGQGACANSSAYSSQIAANKNGNFMIEEYCYNSNNLYGVLYNDNGTQVTVGGVQHFPLGTFINYAPYPTVMALSDNNFLVAYSGDSGTSYQLKKVQPNGTISSAGSYSGVWPSFSSLGDGGFMVFDSSVTSTGGYDYYYTTGARYSNSASLLEAATKLDNAYSDRCWPDPDWGSYCDSYDDTSYFGSQLATGYSKGVLYPNGRTGNLWLHSFVSTGPPPTVTGVTPTSGSSAGGTSVTITGTNFTGASAVKFGSTDASSYTVDSPTQITATSPASSAGTVDITVTTGNGTSSTGSADNFTYLPAPTVTAVSPASGAIAGGTSVVITGTGFTGASAVKFGATNAASYTVDSATQITATAPAGSSGTVDITVTTGNGTSATGSADRFVYPVAPSIATSFGGASMALGATTSLSFTVSNPNSAAALSGISFSDSLPAGLAVATPNGLSTTCNGSATATAGSGTVALSGASLASSGSCTVSLNVTGSSAGTKSNSVSVASTEGGTGNNASASVSVVAPPSLTTSFSPASIAVGGTSSTGFIITNPNSTSLTGVAFTDTLPVGLTVPNASASICGGTVTLTAPRTIAISGATVSASGQCNFSVTTTGAVGGQYTNTTGTVSSTNGGTGNSASATLSVAAPASIAGSFGAATIPVGGSTSLTLTIGNPNSDSALSGVAFTDTLPAGLTVATPNGLTSSCGGSATASAGSGSVSLSGGSVAASGSCTVSFNVTGSSAGTKNNSVTVSATEGGTGNTTSASLTVLAPPTLSTAFGAGSIPLNGTTSLSFAVANPNAGSSLSSVAFSDTLPAGLAVASPNGITGSCGGGSITAVAGSGSVALSGATLTASSSCTFSVNVAGTAAGAQSNSTGQVSSTEGGTGGTASASVTVIAPPTLAASFSPTSISVGGTSSLTFTIANPAGNSASLTGVAFTDTLPVGLTVPNASASVCGGTVTLTAPRTVAVSGASINSGGQCIFSLTVTGAVSGQYSNTTGSVSSTNGGTGNSASANLTVASAPSITGSFGAASVPLNGTTSLSFTVNNPNTAMTLSGLSFTDNLPAGLVVATPSGLASSCGGSATATAGSGSVSLSGGSIASSGSCTVSVNVTGTTAGVKSNSVSVSATEGGTGNTSNASVTVVAPATLSTAFGAGSIPVGGTTSLSFTVSNPNAGTALSALAFSDTLPSGLAVASPNGLSGSCGGGTITAVAGSGSVALSGATVGASGSCTFSVNVTGTAAGVKSNSTGTLSSTEGGTGGTASASVTVIAPPALSAAFSPATITAGGTSSLSFTIANPAGNTVSLTGVSFSDTLPVGLTVSSASAAVCGGTVTLTAPRTISMSGATVAAAGQCQFTVTTTGAVAGPYTNTTGNVSSTEGGTGSSASAALTVNKIVPTVTWLAPYPVPAGTVLDTRQLNATANVAGTFVYTPAAGTALSTGTGQTLSVTFTPTDTVNYEAVTTSVSIDVVKTAQTISFGPLAAKILTDAPFSLSASADSGLPVSYTSSNPAVATVSGSMVTIVGVGVTTITASQAGNAAFAAAASVNQPLTVGYNGTSVPALSVSTLADGSRTRTATLNVSGSASAVNGVKSVIVNGAPVTPGVGGSFSYALTLREGENDVTVTTIDNAGLEVTDTRVVILDTTAPAITVVSPADNAVFSSAAVTVTGAVDTVSTVQVTLNGGAPQATTQSGNDFSIALNLQPGSNTVQIDATDLAGNSSSVSRTLFSDTASPSLAITAPAQDISTDNATITIDGTVSDNLSPVTVTVTVDGQSFTPAVIAGQFQQAISLPLSKQYAVVVTAVDQTGNAATVQRNVIRRGSPTITWTRPAAIVYGTALGSEQLNATAAIPGSFVYSPAAGVVLGAGATQTLSVTFTPDDAIDYAPVSASVTIDVNRAAPVITWGNPTAITYGSTLGVAQQNATANVAGSFVYAPAAGTQLSAGSGQSLNVTFTPTDGVNYAPATKTVLIDVHQATPAVTWSNPAAITYGTALSGTQLNATAGVPGSFVYTPAAGTIMNGGAGQTLTAVFLPTDAADYLPVTRSVSIDVNRAAPVVTWNNPAAIVYGAALGATQLNATADVAGSFVYTPAAGTQLAAGAAQTLSVTFTPSDTVKYSSVTRTVPIDVAKAVPVISWSTPAPMVYGTALSSGQLNASANVPGSFVYTPAAGTLLGAGSAQSVSVSFTPADPANYTAATASILLDVARLPQTVSFAPVAGKQIGAASFTLSATSTSGLPVSYASSDPAVATVSGSTVTVVGAGTTTITASQVGNANYAPAPEVNQPFTVGYNGVLPQLLVSTLTDGSITHITTLNVAGSVTSQNGIKSLVVNGTPVQLDGNHAFSLAIVLAEGRNTLVTTATDNAGQETTDRRSIMLDTAAPAITVTAPADNSSISARTVTATGHLDNPGSVWVSVNDGPLQAATMEGTSFSIAVNLVNGTNTLQFNATDLAGNSTSTAKRSVVSDIAGPSLSVTSPAADTTINATSMVLTGTVSDDLGTPLVTVAMDGQSYTPQVLSGSFQQLLNLPTAKTYAITVTATDPAGNTSSVQRNVVHPKMLGDLTHDGRVDIADALKALQIAVHLIDATPDDLDVGNVAPLVNGVPQPDEVIDIEDAYAILKKAVGSLNF